MYDFIFLLGAQGSGKTTIARILKEKLGSPHIDFDWIRDFHLNKEWSNTNESEEEMSFENLIFILRNYMQHNYHNVIVGGFTEETISKILVELRDYKYIVVTLILTDNEILKQRVLTESRDSGYRDFEKSIEFNKKLIDELKFPNEQKIDNTNQKPAETAKTILKVLNNYSQQKMYIAGRIDWSEKFASYLINK